MSVGERIKELRQQNHISQLQLAKALHVSRQAVSKWETGEATPEVGKLLAISKLFGVTTDYLLNDEAEENTEPEVPSSDFVVTAVNEALPQKNRSSAKKLLISLLICILLSVFVLPLVMAILGYSIFQMSPAVETIYAETAPSYEIEIIPSVEPDETYPYYPDDTVSVSYSNENNEEVIVNFEQSSETQSVSMTNFSVIIILLIFGIPILAIPVLIIALIILLIKRKRQ